MNASTIAIMVASIALIGVLSTAVVALLNGIWTNNYNTGNLEWQKEQWIKNKKQDVFFECLKCLGESMPMPIDKHGTPVSVREQEGNEQEIYIDNTHFLGIMQSLQYVGSWLTIVEGYCSDNVNAARARLRRKEFLRCLNSVLHGGEIIGIGSRPEDAGERRYGRLDYGLSKAHQDAYECVMELASTELLIGKVPVLPN